MNRTRWRARLAALTAALVALTGGGLIITLTDDNGDGKPDRVIVVKPKPVVPAVVGIDGPDRDKIADDTLALDAEAREVAGNAASTPERHDMAGDLRGDDTTPVGQREGPLATPNWPGCSTRFLPTNFSNRVSAVKAIGLHYTAGMNRPGLSDMNGLTGFASSPAAGVSWHFLIDAEGHCYYSVPVTKKAWTIGNLNSQTVNIEVVQVGNENTYPAGTAGAKKLGEVVRRIGRIYRLPMRTGAVDGNCNVTRTGIITHWMGGRCSGGHSDIKPYDFAKVTAAIAAGQCSTRCRRARDLRARNTATHRALKARRCAPIERTRSKTCLTLHRRHRGVHLAARREKIKL